MRTPGHDIELAARFLLTVSIGQPGEIAKIACTRNTAAVKLANGVQLDASGLERNLVMRPLPAKLRESQQVFDRTGGIHTCGLFSVTGEVVNVREDGQCHNAVDKLAGRAFLDNALPLSQNVLLVSGRASFELVQKSGHGRHPQPGRRRCAIQPRRQTALRLGMTLIGFLRGDRFNIYTAASRITD